MANVKTKTVYKIKWKNLTRVLIIFVGIIASCICAYYAYIFIGDYSKTKNNIAYINERIKKTNAVDDEDTRTIAPESTLSKFDIYWDYIKLGLIDVEMASLKRINADSIGYMEIKGTNFNYPIVGYKDGFYKTHSFDKIENLYGWPYLDENNKTDELPAHTIIHVPKQLGSIFTSNLGEVFKSAWNEDDDNFIIRYYMNNSAMLWQIISVYRTDEKDHLGTNFSSDSDLEDFIDASIKLSEVKFKASARTTDNLLTITTDSGKNDIVIFAKLIKIKEEK